MISTTIEAFLLYFPYTYIYVSLFNHWYWTSVDIMTIYICSIMLHVTCDWSRCLWIDKSIDWCRAHWSTDTRSIVQYVTFKCSRYFFLFSTNQIIYLILAYKMFAVFNFISRQIFVLNNKYTHKACSSSDDLKPNSLGLYSFHVNWYNLYISHS